MWPLGFIDKAAILVADGMHGSCCSSHIGSSTAILPLCRIADHQKFYGVHWLCMGRVGHPDSGAILHILVSGTRRLRTPTVRQDRTGGLHLSSDRRTDGGLCARIQSVFLGLAPS